MGMLLRRHRKRKSDPAKVQKNVSKAAKKAKTKAKQKKKKATDA